MKDRIILDTARYTERRHNALDAIKYMLDKGYREDFHKIDNLRRKQLKQNQQVTK